MDSQDYQDYQVAKAVKTPRKSAAGRKLMRWDPDYDQLTLLCAEYVISRDNIPFDWNEVAKLVAPEIDLTGEAIKQHLGKVRKQRTDAGIAVPPVLDRKAARKANNNMVGGGTPTSTPPRRPTKRKATAADLDSGYGGQPTPTSISKTGSLLYTKPKKLKLKNGSAKKEKTIKSEPTSDSDQTFQTPTKKPRGKKKTNFPATANTVVPTTEQPTAMTTPENRIELHPTMAVNYSEDTMEDWENAEEEPEEDKMPSPEQNFAPIENPLPAFEPTHGLPYLTGMAGVGYVPPPQAPVSFGPPVGAFNNNWGGNAAQETLGGFYGFEFPEMPAAPQPASLGDSFEMGEEIPWGMGFLGEGGEEADPPLFGGYQ